MRSVSQNCRDIVKNSSRNPIIDNVVKISTYFHFLFICKEKKIWDSWQTPLENVPLDPHKFGPKERKKKKCSAWNLG